MDVTPIELRDCAYGYTIRAGGRYLGETLLPTEDTLRCATVLNKEDVDKVLLQLKESYPFAELVYVYANRTLIWQD